MLPSTPSPPRRRADHVRSRERILAAAEVVFASDPHASMDAVVGRSGVARATVYRHFPTREELIRSVTNRSLALVGELLVEARPQDGDVLEAITRLTAAAWKAGRASMALVSLAAGGQVDGMKGDQVARVDLMVADLVRRGQAGGVLRADVPAAWLVDLWFATVQSALVHPHPTDTDAVRLVSSLFIRAATVGTERSGQSMPCDRGSAESAR